VRYSYIILSSILLFSCKTQEKIQRNTSLSEIKGSQVTLSFLEIDSVINARTAYVLSEMSEKWKITEYYENAPGDTVLRIKSETEIVRDFKEEKDEIDSTKHYSTTVVETQINDSTMVNTQIIENIDKKNDSRMIQGFEWFWIVIGIAVVIVVAIIIFRLRG